MSDFKASCKWNQKLNFTATIREHHLAIDTKIENGGTNLGPSPKELVVAGIIGCTAMDVASILEKMHQPLKGLQVSGEAQKTAGEPPTMFAQVHLKYEVTGTDLDPTKVIRAVTLSMTKYCGVSAMIAQVAPIKYVVILNGQQIAEDQAHF